MRAGARAHTADGWPRSERATRMTSVEKKIKKENTNNGKGESTDIAHRAIRSTSTPFAFSMINDSEFCNTSRIVLCRSLSSSHTVAHALSRGLSLSPYLRSTSLPLSLSFCFSLLRLPFVSIFRSTAANTLSFSLSRAGTPGYSLYPRFFSTLRYGASINNGPAYSVAAVSTRVVLFVRSLLLCCSRHQRKTSFDPGTTVSYVPGVYYARKYAAREYFWASLGTLAR